MSESAPDEPAVEVLPDDATERASIRTQRLAKLDRLREQGTDPYPYRFDRDRTLGELRDEFGALEAGEETEVAVKVAGRLMLKRDQGRLTFGQLRDRSGEVQLFVSAGVLGKERLAEFNDLDRGDWIGVEGTVMVTKKGELSVKVTAFTLLAKALRPLPDKWKGLSDVDVRFRQRYVDLTVNDDARRVFEVRVAALDALRQVLRARGYLEVETPMLHLQQGGATAGPFVPPSNAPASAPSLRSALRLPPSACSSAVSSGCTRSGGCSATRASTPATTPSSRCSRPTRPTATTTCTWTWWSRWSRTWHRNCAVRPP